MIQPHGGEAFVPGPPGFIVGADYARSGWDLKLADKDGHEAVIKDFFKLIDKSSKPRPRSRDGCASGVPGSATFPAAGQSLASPRAKMLAT